VQSILIGDGRWGLGLVLRRSDGRPVAVATRVAEALQDASTAEALGVDVALDWICASRWNNVTIKSDSKLIIDSINTGKLPRVYWGKS